MWKWIWKRYWRCLTCALIGLAVLVGMFAGFSAVTDTLIDRNISYHLNETIGLHSASAAALMRERFQLLETTAASMTETDPQELADAYFASLAVHGNVLAAAVRMPDDETAVSDPAVFDFDTVSMIPSAGGDRFAFLQSTGSNEVNLVLGCEYGGVVFTAAYESNAFARSTLSGAAFLVVDPDGETVLSTEWNGMRENYFEQIAADEENRRPVEEMYRLLAEGRSGAVSYSYRNERWYCTMAPLNLCGWMLLYRVQAIELDYLSSTLRSGGMWLAVLTLLLFAGILITAFLHDKSSESLRYSQEHNLRASNECLHLMTLHPAALVFDTDLRTGKTYLHGSFVSHFGREPVLNNFPYGAARMGLLTEEDCRRVAALMDQARRGVERGRAEIGMHDSDGTLILCTIRSHMLKDESGIPFRVISMITENTENNGTHAGETDDATGLWTRDTAARRMGELIASKPCALILIDIDNAASLEETLGYEQREAVMADIADIVRRTAGESGCTARMGMDEFAYLATDTTDEGALRSRVTGMVNSINMRVNASLRLSIGGAVSSGISSDTFQDLYFKADTAQYTARQSGSRRMYFYHNS